MYQSQKVGVFWCLNVITMIFSLARYRDEDGEPLMDYDDIRSDPGSPEPQQDLLDDVEDDVGDWGRRERSQTPVYDTDKVGKPRKRLVKKGYMGNESVGVSDLVVDEEENFAGDFVREESESEGKKRKKWNEGKKEKRHKGEKKYAHGGEKGRLSKSGKSEEMNEMWQWVNPEVFLLMFWCSLYLYSH